MTVLYISVLPHTLPPLQIAQPAEIALLDVSHQQTLLFAEVDMKQNLSLWNGRVKTLAWMDFCLSEQYLIKA